MQATKVRRPLIRRPSGGVIALLLITSLTSVASATSTGFNDRLSVEEPTLVAAAVDYSKLDRDADSGELLNTDVSELVSLAMATRVNTTVPRKLPTDSNASILPDKTLSNAAEILAEKRLIESRNDDGPTSTIKTALPGIDVSKLQVFRKQMYRSDI